LDLALR